MLPLLVAATIAATVADQPPAAPREFRGVWVATVDHIDWPPRNVFDSEKQKERLVEIMDRAQREHLNVVVFQVRPMADALYKSNYEPWSEFLTGAQGKPPSPYYDPLEFACWQAHLRGLELHAWINPYRVWHPAAKGRPAPNYLGYTHPSWVKNYGKYQWLDPGEPGVRQWSQAVVMDIVRRYDVDGIHLDDYFYPYPERDAQKKEVPFPDEPSWSAYLRSGGNLSRDEWRRRNVDDFISGLYKEIKQAKPWVKFGISPFGIYRPGVPAGIKAGIDQVNALYSDPLKWLQRGWCDYLSPQLYWPIAQKAQSYTTLADWWGKANVLHRGLYFGNFLSLVSGRWSPSEIVNQIRVTREIPNAGGNVFFSMAPLMSDPKEIDQVLLQGPYSEPALVPACHWLKSSLPHPPKVGLRKTGQGEEISLRRESQDTYEWGIYTKSNSGWTFRGVESAQQAALLPATLGPNISEMAVSSLDRYGNESSRVVVKL